MKKVILNMGAGTLGKGCETIIGEILDGQQRYPVRFTGHLPPAPELALQQQRWQKLYAVRNQDQSLRIQLLNVDGIRYSEAAFTQISQALVVQFNSWLKSDAFRSVERRIRTELKRTDDVQLILETRDPQLRRLPWHLWQLCEDYPRVELTFGASDWQPLTNARSKTDGARVLATFGNDNGLDLQADLAALNRLPDTHLTVLESPSVNQLHESLWEPDGWDIFFFAGHSQTQDEQGIVSLNETDRLTVDQIKHALEKAIANGLKIAIFNACDGLGLAAQLSALQIPYVVVMREPVPDHIAQQFLQYLLTAFAGGAPFHLAVKEARQRLAGLETEIPCASWLPVIWQNPTAPAIYWQDFQRQQRSLLPSAKSANKIWSRSARQSFWKAGLVAGAVMGLRLLALLEPVELIAYDHLMRQRPIEPLDDRNVVIEIGEKATSQYRYPLPDDVLVDLIEKINQAQPLAIGLDVHRPKPVVGPAQPVVVSSDGGESASQSTGYERFLQQVEENPNLFLVCAYGSQDENYQAPPELPQALQNTQVGFSDLPIDAFRMYEGRVRSDLSPQGSTGLAGNNVRRHLLSYHYEWPSVNSTCTTPYSLSFQLAFEYLTHQGVSPIDVTEDEYWQFGSVVFPSLPRRFGGYQNLQGLNDQILLNYRTEQPALKLTIEQILTDNFELEMLRDRVVMIGYTAPVSKDYFETPYGPMPGLWVHAHMVSQLMSAVIDGRPLIHTLPQWKDWQWGDMLWILAWSVTMAYISWRVRRRSLWLVLVGSGASALYIICLVAIADGLWLPLIPALLSGLVSASWVRLSLSTERKLPVAEDSVAE